MDTSTLAAVIDSLEQLLASPGAMLTARVRDRLERDLRTLKALLAEGK